LIAAFFVTVLVALAFAQRAFIAADIAALPFALILLFLGFVTLGSVDFGRLHPSSPVQHLSVLLLPVADLICKRRLWAVSTAHFSFGNLFVGMA
jgi:hypothetical protein